MAYRKGKFVSAVVTGMLAGVSLAILAPAPVQAECLTEAGPGAAQGQHWYYRIERGSGRHCWYLREQGEKAAHATSPESSATPGAPKAPTRSDEAASARSLEDARAEFPTPQTGDTSSARPAPVQSPAATANSPFANPPGNTSRGSAVAARWPNPVAPASAGASPPPPGPSLGTAAMAAAATTTPTAPDSASAADNSTDVQDDATTTPTTGVAPVGTTLAGAPAARPTGSLQMLFVVILGALALAGLTASIVFRFGRRRTRRPREAIWDSLEGEAAPWVEAPRVKPAQPNVGRAARRPELGRSNAQTAATRERLEKMEELLAQLVKQAQTENEPTDEPKTSSPALDAEWAPVFQTGHAPKMSSRTV